MRLWEQSRCHFWTVEIESLDWDWVKNGDLEVSILSRPCFLKLPRLSEQLRCHFLDCRDQKSWSRPCRDKPRHPITILKFGLNILITYLFKVIQRLLLIMINLWQSQSDNINRMITLNDFILIQSNTEEVAYYDHFVIEPKC